MEFSFSISIITIIAILVIIVLGALKVILILLTAKTNVLEAEIRAEKYKFMYVRDLQLILNKMEGLHNEK